MARVFSTEVIRIKLQGEGALPQDNGDRVIITKAMVGGNEVEIALWARWSSNADFRLHLVCTGGCLRISQATIYSGVGSKLHCIHENVFLPIPNVLSHVFASCGHLVVKAKFSIQNISEWCNNMATWIRHSGPHYQRLALEDCDQCGPFSGAPDFFRSGLNMRCFMNGPLMKDQETNFEIHVGDVTFYTHKVILMSESAGFQGMILNEFEEKRTGSVTIEDCTPDDMRALLTVYYDRFKFGDYAKDCGKLGGVFELSSKYLIDDIKKRCLKAFRTVAIEPDQFCDLIRMADQYDAPELMERCAKESSKLPDEFYGWESTIQFISNHPRAYLAYSKVLAKQRKPGPSQ